jgi:ribosomal protein L13E
MGFAGPYMALGGRDGEEMSDPEIEVDLAVGSGISVDHRRESCHDSSVHLVESSARNERRVDGLVAFRSVVRCNNGADD